MKNSGQKAVVLDFIDVKHADMSGIIVMQEVIEEAHKRDLRVFLVNISAEVQGLLTRARVQGDDITACSFELQDNINAALAVAGGASAECLDEESLGMVSELLKETRAGSLLELAQWSAAKERSNKVATTAPTPTAASLRRLGESKDGAVYSLVSGIDQVNAHSE